MIPKRKIFFLLILFVGFSFLSAQSLIQDAKIISEQDLETEVLEEVIVYTADDWFELFNLSGDEYYQQFNLLLLHDSSKADLQPYALAECLWFNCVIKPSVEETEIVMELQKLVNTYLSEIDTGKIIPKETSDAVYFLLKNLFSLKPCPKNILQVPELQIFSVEHLFHLPSQDIQSVKMYRALALYQKIMSENADMISDKILSYVNNPALLYVYLNDSATEKIIPEQLKDLSVFYKCHLLHQECTKLSVKYGFNLLEVLPNFSKSILNTATENEFILCCISESDLNQLYVDLTCIKDFVPKYFYRYINQITGGELK